MVPPPVDPSPPRRDSGAGVCPHTLHTLYASGSTTEVALGLKGRKLGDPLFPLTSLRQGQGQDYTAKQSGDELPPCPGMVDSHRGGHSVEPKSETQTQRGLVSQVWEAGRRGKSESSMGAAGKSCAWLAPVRPAPGIKQISGVEGFGQAYLFCCGLGTGPEAPKELGVEPFCCLLRPCG